MRGDMQRSGPHLGVAHGHLVTDWSVAPANGYITVSLKNDAGSHWVPVTEGQCERLIEALGAALEAYRSGRDGEKRKEQKNTG
jgi:hypothetical protein